MTKVLIILDNDYIHDGRVQKEVSILQKFNIDYRILCYDYAQEYTEDKRIIRINNGLFLKYKLEAIVNTIPIITRIWTKWIRKVIKEFRAEVIHIHDLYMMPPVLKAITNLTSRPKLLLDLHENFPYAIYNYEYATKGIKRFFVRPHVWKKKEKYLLESADSIIVLDHTFGESLQHKYPALNKKEIIEFPNYPDYNILDKNEPIDFSIDDSFPVMLYFGGIAKSRGITESIHAFKEVIKKGKLLTYLFIGPINNAYKEEFNMLINDPEVAQHIKYIPWIKISQLKAIMQKCSFAIAPFHVNPQIESGIANKIFQYLYGGLPVIVSNAKPMAKLVTENNCGLVFKENETISNCINSYLNNKQLLTSHSENGKRTIEAKFKPEKFEEALIAIYLPNITGGYE